MMIEEVKYLLNQHQIQFSESGFDVPFTPFKFLYLPDNQLIIHFVDFTNTITERHFFQNLSNHFNAQSLRIIHLWEDVWMNKKSVCQSRILAMCGFSERIPSRLTQVRRIDKLTSDKFLQENHITANTISKFKYGLFLPERYFRVLKNTKFEIQIQEMLIAVATFSNAKTIIREGKECRSYQLIRFANLKNTTVVGGLDKLLKAFITEHQPDDIMTYADRDWSDGKSYNKLGFQKIGTTLPQGFYYDKDLLLRYYENKLNEHEKLGMKPIFNAGNVKFIRFL